MPWQDEARFAPKTDLQVVGLKFQTKKVQEKLRSARRLGIVGMGGLGKTTLAKTIYDAIWSDFEYACFLDTIKNNSMAREERPADLRAKIIDKLYRGGRKVHTNFHWKKLKMKKVLIVLDDAEYECQVNVMTEADEFYEESRLIVTSRNKGFLVPSNFEFYKAEGLSPADSKVLFCVHAFEQSVAPKIPKVYEQRVTKFVEKCAGLPLALKVTGRYLYKQDTHVWDDALEKLRLAKPIDGSNEDGLWSILGVSYDSLAPDERKMFLDAATVFHGEDLKKVQKLWSYRGWGSWSGWRNLMDRSLAGCDEYRHVVMLEVLRDLGQRIACPDPEDVVNHTRVFDIKKAKHLFEIVSASLQHGQELSSTSKELKRFPESLPQLEGLRIWRLDDLRVAGLTTQAALHFIDVLRRRIP